jgi:MFS family permease
MLNVGPGRRDLVIALAGRLTSTFGDEVALVALTLRLQGDGARPYEVALLLAAGTVPLLLLARAVGRVVDRYDSRTLLLGAGLAEVAATAPLVVVHSVVAIVMLVAVLGAAQLLSATTWSALIPRVVGEEHVAPAVSAMQSLNALVMVGAPAVGGLLAGAFGTRVPLAVDLATFIMLLAAAALVRTRRRPSPVMPDASAERDHGGFALLRRDRVLAPLTVGVALVVLLVGMVDVVLVFLVRDTLRASAAWYGTAQAAWMTGMVAGALGGGRLRTEAGRTWATLVGIGVVCAALAPFALVPSVWMLVPLSILGGIANGYASVCFSTLLVTRTPDANRGRVSAATNAVLGGAQGLSLLAGGALAVVFSPRAIYGMAGALGVIATVVITARQLARSPGRSRRSAPLS